MALADSKARRTVVTPSDIILGSSSPKSAPDLLGNNKILYRSRASFLAGLFPDELIVQEKSITVVYNSLFASHDETMPIKDIGRVVSENTAFFTTLRFLGKNPSHEMHITGLWNKSASFCKELIEGLLLISEEKQNVAIRSAEAAEALLAGDHSEAFESNHMLHSETNSPINSHR